MLLYRLKTRAAAAILAGAIFLPAGSALGQQPGMSSGTGDVARGAVTWNENCARCHNMRQPNEFRDDQWHVIANHMRLRAGLTGQETRDVVRFLQQSN